METPASSKRSISVSTKSAAGQLEHLIRKGLVRRIESLNAYLPSGETAQGPVVFAIWDDCGRVQQREAGAAVGQITAALAKDGFHAFWPVVGP